MCRVLFRTAAKPVLFTIVLLATTSVDAARRSLRIDFGAWGDSQPLGSEQCQGTFEQGPDVIWRGVQFSGSRNAWFNQDSYCQSANQYDKFDYPNPSDHLSSAVFGTDEAGLAEKIGSNNSENLARRVYATRFTFLDEDRFSTEDQPEGYQWAFYFFPDDVTLVTLYGETPVGTSGFTPAIYNRYGTIWDSADQGYDGEYFCFEGNLYIGTWDGTLTESGAPSRCEMLLGELISDSGFETLPSTNNAAIYPSDSGIEMQSGFGLVVADFNSDQKPDVVTGFTYSTSVLINNGTSSPFSGVPSVETPDIFGYRVIAVGDMDDSGEPDLVVGADGLNQVYLNNGSADPFAGVTGLNIGAEGQWTIGIEVGDIDGDDDVDVVVSNRDSEFTRLPIQLYKNNGSDDPFAGVSPESFSPDYQSINAVDDINGDGALDLISIDDAGAARVYLNNGSLNPFTSVTPIVLGGSPLRARTLAVGDVNGDGHSDLLVAAFGGGPLTDGYYNAVLLYLNNGSPDAFTGVSPHSIARSDDDVSTMTLGDVDNDGNIDLLTSGSDTTRLYLNTGGANPFAGVRGLYISRDTSRFSLLLGDFDSDSKLDLISDDRIYLNQH
jgi:hypothetical protein